MANVWHCGFENASATAGHEWDSNPGTSAPVTSASGTHGGGSLGQRSLRCQRVTNGTCYGQHQFAAAANAGQWFYGFSLQVDTLPAAQCKIFTITQAITDAVSIRLETSGALSLYRDDSGVQLGSSSSALSTGVVYYISLMWDSTTGVGTATAKLNDVQFATGTATNNQSQYRVKFGIQTSTTADIFIDDIIVNNASGSYNNTYPTSTTYLIAARPNAAGDTNTCGSGSYADVDEQTADDATTIATFTADGQILDVNMEDVATLYSLTSTTDTLPFIGVWSRDAVISTTKTITYNRRIKSQASGTVGSGASITHNDNTYKTNGDAAPLLPYVSETDPQDSAVWTVSDLSNFQIGFTRTANAGGGTLNLTQLWAYVCVKRTPVVTDVVKDIINGLGIVPFARA